MWSKIFWAISSALSWSASSKSAGVRMELQRDPLTPVFRAKSEAALMRCCRSAAIFTMTAFKWSTAGSWAASEVCAVTSGVGGGPEDTGGAKVDQVLQLLSMEVVEMTAGFCWRLPVPSSFTNDFDMKNMISEWNKWFSWSNNGFLCWFGDKNQIYKKILYLFRTSFLTRNLIPMVPGPKNHQSQETKKTNFLKCWCGAQWGPVSGCMRLTPWGPQAHAAERGRYLGQRVLPRSLFMCCF